MRNSLPEPPVVSTEWPSVFKHSLTIMQMEIVMRININLLSIASNGSQNEFTSSVKPSCS